MSRRPTFAERACLLCGQTFTPTNGRQRFCTVEHWQQHRRGGSTVRGCRLCGQPFTPTNGNQRFCTPEHQREYQRLHNPQTIAGWRERVRRLEAEIARARARLDDREAA
jgi:hypothetical protein